MLFAFFLSLFAASSVFANHGPSVKSSSSVSASVAKSVACTEQLEGVVYVPKNCAYNYLKSINKVLQVQSPLLWGTPSQAQSVILSFQNTYNVLVVLYDAMGNAFSAPGVPISGAPVAQFAAYERSNALGEGFTANTPVNIEAISAIGSFSVYTSIFWNVDGQMYNVAIMMASANTPNFC